MAALQHFHRLVLLAIFRPTECLMGFALSFRVQSYAGCATNAPPVDLKYPLGRLGVFVLASGGA